MEVVIQKKEIYVKKFLAAFLLVLGFLVIPQQVQAPIIEYQSSFFLIEQNSVKAIVSPIYIKPIIYGSLISCLEYYESEICRVQDREKCIGKDNEKGCLQFKDETFITYCIQKYKIAISLKEIWDCEVQKRCANLMIEDGLKNHWTTYKKCY